MRSEFFEHVKTLQREVWSRFAMLGRCFLPLAPLVLVGFPVPFLCAEAPLLLPFYVASAHVFVAHVHSSQ